MVFVFVDYLFPPGDLAYIIDGVVELKIAFGMKFIETLEKSMNFFVDRCHLTDDIFGREKFSSQLSQSPVIKQGKRVRLELEGFQLSGSELLQEVHYIVNRMVLREFIEKL